MKVEVRIQINSENDFQSSTVYKVEENERELSKEEYHDIFIQMYLFGEKEEAMKLVPFIDPNYDEGFLVKKAAQRADIEMLTALLNKGATAGIQDALVAAARKIDDKGCINLLIQHGANPLLLRETDLSLNPAIQAFLPYIKK
jgi:hypothetical protein